MRSAILASICTLLTGLALGGCSSGPKQPPEEFALQVARTIAENDYEAYSALASRKSQAIASDSNPVPTGSLGESLAELEEPQIHQQFDRVVAAGRIRTSALDSYRAVVTATEPDRWVLDIQDQSGKNVGVQVQLRAWQDSYRVSRVNLH